MTVNYVNTELTLVGYDKKKNETLVSGFTTSVYQLFSEEVLLIGDLTLAILQQ
jgi:hypothetical protein